jgi:hypothetical protein
MIASLSPNDTIFGDAYVGLRRPRLRDPSWESAGEGVCRDVPRARRLLLTLRKTNVPREGISHVHHFH